LKYFLLVIVSLTCLIAPGCASRRGLGTASQSTEATAGPPAGETKTNNERIGHRLSFWIDRSARLDDAGRVPPAAEDCALIYDPPRRRLVLFGGKNDNDENLAQTWTMNLDTGRWTNVTPSGLNPSPSEDHTAIYDPLGDRMILYGGENGPTWNATWAFDLKNHVWTDLTDSTAPRREDHTAVFDSRGKRMVVFGGRDNAYYNLHEIWTLDLDPQSPTYEQWHMLPIPKKHPEGRSDHVAVYDSLKNRMIIFGGWDKIAKEYLDDTWSFFFERGIWKKIKAKRSHPPKRRHAVGAYDTSRNWFIICGGFGDEGYLNDVWALDLATDTWINITPGPQPRIDHQAVYDPVSQRLVLYGGDARLGTKFHDLWELQIMPQMPTGLIDVAQGRSVVKVKPKDTSQ